MIGGLAATSALPTFLLALLIFGFAPGMVLALVVKLLNKEDPRRRELQAELYAVPRWERPFWVCQQFEVGLREGFAPNVSWWLGRVWLHRAKLESGLELHRQYPETFEIPDAADKRWLEPGDFVKLMWAVRRSPGERMWVEILQRKGDRVVGRLSNEPLFAHMNAGDTIKFHIDQIIDFELDDDRVDDDDDAVLWSDGVLAEQVGFEVGDVRTIEKAHPVRRLARWLSSICSQG